MYDRVQLEAIANTFNPDEIATLKEGYAFLYRKKHSIPEGVIPYHLQQALATFFSTPGLIKQEVIPEILQWQAESPL